MVHFNREQWQHQNFIYMILHSDFDRETCCMLHACRWLQTQYLFKKEFHAISQKISWTSLPLN